MMYCLSILSNSNFSSPPEESIFMATFRALFWFVLASQISLTQRTLFFHEGFDFLFQFFLKAQCLNFFLHLDS